MVVCNDAGVVVDPWADVLEVEAVGDSAACSGCT